MEIKEFYKKYKLYKREKQLDKIFFFRNLDGKISLLFQISKDVQFDLGRILFYRQNQDNNHRIYDTMFDTKEFTFDVNCGDIKIYRSKKYFASESENEYYAEEFNKILPKEIVKKIFIEMYGL